jgi:hypothetical protein
LNLTKARTKRWEEVKFDGTCEVEMPDSSIHLVREKEATFIIHRLKQYKDDFEWTESADYGLLTKLLLLELQTNRINELLSMGYKSTNANALAKLTEEYRKVQADLGISRTKRLDRKEVEDAPKIVRGMMDRFLKYKKEHPEKFQFKCKKCGQINDTNILNSKQEE